jgi:hypothetical protein
VDDLPGDTGLFDSGEGNTFCEGLGDGFDGFVLALFQFPTRLVDFPEEGEAFEFCGRAFFFHSVP